MSSLPSDVWSLITSRLLDVDVKSLTCTSKHIRINALKATRSLYSESPSWPIKLLQFYPSIETFWSCTDIEDWNRLSSLPNSIKHFIGGFIAGQEAPDFRQHSLLSLQLIAPFISWKIVESLPPTLTKLVLQECRYFSDRLFGVLPRNLQSLQILRIQTKWPFPRKQLCCSTSFITDLAFRDLPPSLTELKVHSTCPFTELALKLLPASLTTLELRPTYFKSHSYRLLSPQLVNVIFLDAIPGSEMPNMLPDLQKLKLGFPPATPLLCCYLPSSLTMIRIDHIQEFESTPSFAYCLQLRVLKLHSLCGSWIIYLPRSLVCLIAPNRSSSPPADIHVSELPQALKTLHCHADFTASVAEKLPDLHDFVFSYEATPCTLPFKDLLQEEPATFTDIPYESISLNTYIQHLKERRQVRLDLANGASARICLKGYEFCERERRDMKDLTFGPFLENPRGILKSPPDLPPHLTRLSIDSSSILPLTWLYISDWILPESLTVVKMPLSSIGVLKNPSSGVGPFIRSVGSDDEDTRTDDTIEKDESPSKSSSHTMKENTRGADLDASQYLAMLPPLSEVMESFNLLVLPPHITSLSVHLVITGSQLPSTLRKLSCGILPHMHTFMLLNHLPPHLESLNIRTIAFKSRDNEHTRLEKISRSSDTIHLAREFYRIVIALPFGEKLLSEEQSPSSFARYNNDKSAFNLDDTSNVSHQPYSAEFNLNESEEVPLLRKDSGVSESTLNEDVWILSWLQKVPDSILVIFICWISHRLTAFRKITLTLTLPLVGVLREDMNFQTVLALGTSSLVQFWWNGDIWEKQNDGSFEKFSKSKDGLISVSHADHGPTMENQVTPVHERAKHVHVRGSHASLPQPCDPPSHRLDSTFQDDSFLLYLSSEAAGPYPMEILRLYQNKMLSESSFRILPPTLTVLDVLENQHITDETISFLPKTLLKLSIGSFNLTDDCIPSLPPLLNYLDLASKAISDFSIPLLPRSLVSLYLRQTSLISDANLDKLPSYLETLSLAANTKISDLGVSMLPRSLTSLNLYQNNLIGDKGMALLSPALTELWLPMNRQITDNCFAKLPRNLFILCLNSISQIRPQTLAMLPPYLHRLHIDGATNLTAEDLQNLPPTVARLRVTGFARAREEVVLHCPLLRWDIGYIPPKRHI